jgi:hypothetical protein
MRPDDPHNSTREIYLRTDGPVRIEPSSGGCQELCLDLLRHLRDTGLWKEAPKEQRHLTASARQLLPMMLTRANLIDGEIVVTASYQELADDMGWSRTNAKEAVGDLRTAKVVLLRHTGGGTAANTYVLRCPQRAPRAAHSQPATPPPPRRAALAPPDSGPDRASTGTREPQTPGGLQLPGHPGRPRPPGAADPRSARSASTARIFRTSSPSPRTPDEELDHVVVDDDARELEELLGLLMRHTFQRDDALAQVRRYPADSIRRACRNADWKSRHGGFRTNARAYIVDQLQRDQCLFTSAEAPAEPRGPRGGYTREDLERLAEDQAEDQQP